MVCITLLQHGLFFSSGMTLSYQQWNSKQCDSNSDQSASFHAHLPTGRGPFFQDFLIWGIIVKATSPTQANGPRSCTVTDDAHGLKAEELADTGRLRLCQLEELTCLFRTPHPSSSHCQGTHSSMHNHATVSLSSESTTPKLFAILLTDIKNQFSKSLGENHSIIFFQIHLLHLDNASGTSKTLRKTRLCINLLCCKWTSVSTISSRIVFEWEPRTQVSKLLCSSKWLSQLNQLQD